MKVLLLRILSLVLTTLVGKVDVPALNGWIAHTIEKLKTVVIILTDDNKNNKEQLQMFWKAIEDDFKNESLETAINIIKEKIHNEQTRQLILQLIEEAMKNNTELEQHLHEVAM